MSRLFTVVLWLALSCGPSLADTVHKTYFENTDYELHVYEIRGHEAGPTMIIIGGIQGDEPGGYLSADLYADLSLRKGNLIVVPRANFYAILLNERGPNGDMNRMFNELSSKDIEIRIVGIIKELINGSDVLLNLHDGSGFFREENIDELHNPMKFGQSIIADADVYVSPTSGKTIVLGDIARKICSQVNPHIPEEEYKFHFNNHNTASKKTLHPEQRLSATYYSLTRHEIPAFGIESSKEIPSDELKVRQKSMIINAFMNEFGIVPENPKILVEKPQLNHVIVLINGGERVAVKDGETLRLNRGDQIIIEHIDMDNYKRGLSGDIIGMGGINDLGKPFNIDYSTRIIIRKDSFKCASVNISISKEPLAAGLPRVAELASQYPNLEFLTLEVDGERHEVRAGDTLEVPKGAVLEITEAVIDKPVYGKALQVNFKGFVGDPVHNTGDDRGFKIQTGISLLGQWSLEGKGESFPIVVSCLGREIGTAVIRLVESAAANAPVAAEPAGRYPSLNFLALEVDGERRQVRAGDTLEVRKGAVLVITEAVTDQPADSKSLQVNFKGFVGDPKNNTGDDRGYKIQTKAGLLDKYSLNGKGETYPIVIFCLGREIGTVLIRLIEPQASAIK